MHLYKMLNVNTSPQKNKTHLLLIKQEKEIEQ